MQPEAALLATGGMQPGERVPKPRVRFDDPLRGVGHCPGHHAGEQRPPRPRIQTYLLLSLLPIFVILALLAIRGR